MNAGRIRVPGARSIKIMKPPRSFLASAALLLFLSPLALPAGVVTLTPVADTALFEQIPDNNLGASQSVAAGNTAAASATRALMKFDLREAVPAGSRIVGASLELTVVRASALVEPATFHAHRLLVDWGEGNKGVGTVTGTGSPADNGEATWNSRFHGQTQWSSPGGASGIDYASEMSATARIGTTEPLVFSSSALAGDVQRWVDEPASNFGWMFKDAFEGSATTARRIGSREHPTAQPKLVVQFEAPLRILSSGLRDGKFCLKFMAQGRGYIVQAREAVDSGDWQTVWVLPAADVPMEVEICDPAPVTGAKFYRVMEL